MARTRLQAASIYLLLAIFVLSLVTFISAIKYVNWAEPQTERSKVVALVFYAGTMPLASLAQSSVHIGVLHFDAILPHGFAIFLAAAQMVGWFVVGGIWAGCEASEFPTRGLCPQADMFEFGKNGLTGLATFKDILAFVLALSYMAMLVLAILSRRAKHLEPWKRRSEFLELAAYETVVE